MPMGVPMQRVYDVATEMSKKYLATDFSSDCAVQVHHEDQTKYWFVNAFAMIYYDKDHGDEGACEFPGEWLMVFTEHHDHHVFHLDEIESWSPWKQQEFQKHPDYPPYNFRCLNCNNEMIELTQFFEGSGCPSCGEASDQIEKINT